MKKPLFRTAALNQTILLTALCTTLAFAGGCAESKPKASADDVPDIAVDAKAAALLPDAIKESDVLRVAIPTNEPPTQYYKDGTQEMTGINPDIARLIGETLGLDVEIKVANFDAIIPGMAAGRYDMTVSSMTPTTERMEVLDFVDYLQIGNALAVAKDNPLDLDESSLCGHKVGLLTGSYQLTVNVPDYNDACEAAGEPDIVTSQYGDTRQAISALLSGRQEAVLADSPILNYAASQNPDLTIASAYEFAPVAVGVGKDTGLKDALAAAVAQVIKSDAYQEVLATYGVETAAITDARVNVAQ